MGDLARFSLYDVEPLYKEFGIDAELLIDHAWGEESCTMEDIKAYKPETNSFSSGQLPILHAQQAWLSERTGFWRRTSSKRQTPR